MKDEAKTEEQLIAELRELRERVAELEKNRAECKQTEEALRKSENRYRSLVETSSDWLWEIDANGRYTYVSSRAREIFGYAPEEVVGRTPFDLMPEEEARRVGAIFAEIAAERRPFALLENVNLHRDGRRVVLETSGVPVFGPDGEYAGYRGIDRDITERKRTEQALQESEYKFLRLAESIPGMVFQYVLHKDGSLSLPYVNDRIMQYGGIRPEEAMADPALLLSPIHPDDQEMLKEAISISAQTLQDLCVEHRLIDPKGRLRWFRVGSRPQRLPNGDTLWSGVSIEITERKLAEEALKERERKFRAIFDQTFQFIGLVTIDGSLMEANRTALQFAGVQESDITGKPFWETPWWTHSTVLQEKLREAVKKAAAGELVRFEATHPSADGSLQCTDFSLKPVMDEAGGVAFLIAEARDINERKRAEEALQQSEREKAILNQIANVFLTIPDEKIFEEVLAVILKAFKCRYGVFGYIGDSGDLIIPSMTREIWSDCQVEGKSMVFPRHLWGDSLWGKAIKEKESFYSEGPFETPEGHLPVYNFLTVPIVFADKTIGLASVANKDGGFSVEDKTVLERIAGNISPILNARLQRDKQELERKRVEEALRAGEARLRQIIDLVPHKIFVKSRDGKFLLANKAVAESFNTSVSAITGKYHVDFHPDETEVQNMLQDDLEVITKGETKFIPEEPYTDAQGNLCFQQTTKVPFHLLDDKTPAVLGVAIDITSIKRAEEVLRESEEQFRTVVHDSPNPIFILKEGCFVFVNDAAVRLYGAASKEELLGHDIVERLHPDYRARVAERIRSAIEEGKQSTLMEQKHVKLDGTIMDVQGTSTRIRYQKGYGVLAFVRDVSEQRRMEAALREAWLYTRSLIEASVDPLVTISPEGKITDVSKATELVTGFSRKRLIGSDFSDYFTEPDKARAGYRKVISQGFVKDYPLTIRHSSGRLTDVLYNAAVYKSEAGKVQGVFAAARDITERKRMEEAVRESDAYLDAAIESIPFEFWAIDSDGRYAAQNRICRERYGDIIGKRPEDVSPNEGILRVWLDNNRRAFAGEPVQGEVMYFFGNEERYFYNVVAPIRDAGRTLGIVGVNVDITERKRLEAALKKVNEELESQVEERTKELSAKNRRLEEFNTALRILLKQREEDKTELEESVLSNVKSLIVPYVEKLKRSRLDRDQMTHLAILESHIREIASPFSRTLSEKYFGLSPLEVQTAGLIREGKTTQEIAESMCVSENTVSSHRFHIRKKLGLANKKVNLRTYLQSLDK